MKFHLVFILFVCAIHTAWPCINTSGTKYGGGTGSYFGWRGLQASLKANLQPTGKEMESDLRASTNFTDRSDYAVALMYLGRSQEAVGLLNQLEKERPGEYFVAGNLGTAYELSGNNEEALRWIREAIRRNPASHEGTEWLHEKILEAKIAQQKEPALF
jgi:tetratricopeptide (TPR) repeat protein